MKAHEKVGAAFGWKFFERICVQGTNFLVTLLLARVLSPADYGTVSIIMIFVTLSNTFVQGGFNTALIQKRAVDESDYKTIFVFSSTVALFLYIVLFASAPLIASFYNVPELRKLLRVVAIVLFPGALNSVQVAYITRQLRFKILTISSFCSAIAAGIIGIVFAYRGAGAWALVVQQIINQVGNCVMTYILIRWFPHGKFSVKKLKLMLPFGSKVFASNFITALFLDIRSLLIGKVYSSDTLGYFNRGKQFPQAIMESVNGTIQTVLLPIYSRKQDFVDSVAHMVSQVIRMLSLVLFPVIFGLAAVAEPLVRLLLTDSWLECVPYLKIFSFSYLFLAVQLSTIQAYKAIGDSGTPLKLEIIKKTIEMIFLFATIRYGVYPMAVSMIVSQAIAHILNMFAAKRILNYPMRNQLRDLLPATAFSLIMVLGIKFVSYKIQSGIWNLIVSIALGIAIYMTLCLVFRVKEFYMIFTLLKSKLKKADKA